MDYGGDSSNLHAVYGSVLINCTGVSTNVQQALYLSLYAEFSYVSVVTGSFSLLGCSTISTLDFYTVTTIGGDLTITNNPTLGQALVDQLKSIKGSINVQLETTNGISTYGIDLTALQTVGGNINITGPVASFTHIVGQSYVMISILTISHQSYPRNIR